MYGRDKLCATTSDGDRLDANVIGDDPLTDLAVVRLAARDLPASEPGDSAILRVGQLVIAMADPLGLQSTVSTGVISSLGRSMRGEGGRLIGSVVQHSASLNPGNSGGPLINFHSRVIGTNTAIVALAQGLGFAIRANTATCVVGELLAHGCVRRPWLSITATVIPLPRHVVREPDLPGDRAVKVVSVEPDGPASKSQMWVGDLIRL